MIGNFTICDKYRKFLNEYLRNCQGESTVRFTLIFNFYITYTRCLVNRTILNMKGERNYRIQSTGKILSFSERSISRAWRIFRLVSNRQGIPFSIRSMVNGETFAFLASSALLIITDSLIFFKLFLLIYYFAKKCVETL